MVSTREISRNVGSVRYLASLAEKSFVISDKRAKLLLLAGNTDLREIVTSLLELTRRGEAPLSSYCLLRFLAHHCLVRSGVFALDLTSHQDQTS